MRIYETHESAAFASANNISEKQADILLNYMAGHGYALGIQDGTLYRIDIEDSREEADEYPLRDAVNIVREWIDELVQDTDTGVSSTDGYTIKDMVDEDSYTRFVGIARGSWGERENKRAALLQFKLDDIELDKLVGTEDKGNPHFSFMGNTFLPIRNLTSAEQAFENVHADIVTQLSRMATATMLFMQRPKSKKR